MQPTSTAGKPFLFDLIVAMGPNGEIGRGYGLPWPRESGDLKHFRGITTKITNADIIVGKKTASTLPVSGLPGRRIVAVSSTRGRGQRLWGLQVRSLFDALTLQAPARFVAGGAVMYRRAIEEYGKHLQKAFVTMVLGRHMDCLSGEIVSLDPQTRDLLMGGPRSNVIKHPNGCVSFVVEFKTELRGGPPLGPTV
jgi:dihydrofolate reductase